MFLLKTAQNCGWNAREEIVSDQIDDTLVTFFFFKKRLPRVVT